MATFLKPHFVLPCLVYWLRRVEVPYREFPRVNSFSLYAFIMQFSPYFALYQVFAFPFFFIDLKIFLQMIKEDLFPLSCDKQLALNRVLNIDFQFNLFMHKTICYPLFYNQTATVILLVTILHN